MSAIVLLIFVAVAGLALFDLAADRWGVDSRSWLNDDHNR
jgi:hypothetical protein